MDRDAGAERRGSGGRRGRPDELQQVNNKWIFCLSPSLLLCGSIHLLCHHHLSPIAPVSHAHPLSTLSSPLFPFPFWISSPFLCFLSISRHGWQRSMSTPSRTWSSCCWATRWGLVANNGRWMDRWTHRGREGGIMEGGMGGSGVYGGIYGCVWRQGKRFTLYVLQMSQNVYCSFQQVSHCFWKVTVSSDHWSLTNQCLTFYVNNISNDIL